MDIKCSVCGGYCNLWLKSFQDYVYKVKLDSKYIVQCSYKCWRTETKRRRPDGQKEDRGRCL